MIQHKKLFESGWSKLTLPQQMANIGSEGSRVVKWLAKGRIDNAERAFERMQELVDLTIAYGRRNSPNRKALLKEICRFRELYCEAFLASNLIELTSLNHYLDHFANIKN